VLSNLREAIELHFEDEDSDEVGYFKKPVLFITFKLYRVTDKDIIL